MRSTSGAVKASGAAAGGACGTRAGSEGAPIRGTPEVLLSGLSRRNICPGKYFPPNMPDAGDFPLNEANYRRDFAIRITPDRTKTGASGALKIRFALRHVSRRLGADPPGTPFTEFRVPVTITDKFRPESITAEPSQRESR